MAKKMWVKGCEGLGEVLEPAKKQNVWAQVAKRTEGRETYSLVPTSTINFRGEENPDFEQLEYGFSLVHLICLGMPLPGAVKPLAWENAWPAKGLSACQLQSLTLPTGKRKPPSRGRDLLNNCLS